MKRLKIYGAVAALVLTSTASLAFQEDTTGKAQAPSAGAAAGLSTTTAAKRTDSGTVVSIPGLGKLGVLPKMDFGLELLYGATDVPGSDGNSVVEPDSQGDLKVRGEIKHRF